MPSYRSNPDRLPKLTHHKASGKGVVRLNGRDHYCGAFGTPECQATYLRFVSEWLANGRREPAPKEATPAPGDITINEMLMAFRDWAEGYYRKNGEPTGEATVIRYAVRPLREMFGDTLAAEFGPMKLKAVRQRMVDSGLCRNECNRRTRIIVRAFRWAVGEELIPPSVHLALAAVPGIPKGRTSVRESEAVTAVPDAVVDAVLPYTSRQVRAMIELQRVAGMRPGEVCAMRTIDIDTSGLPWWYLPADHKCAHHGLDRRIPLGPAAREILGDWLRPHEPEAYLFQPKEAEAERRTAMRAARKSPVQPSQQDRRLRKPSKSAGNVYDANSYRRAIHYAVRKANRARRAAGMFPIEPFAPNQIRHLAADRISHSSDADAARTILGHRSVRTTEIYMSRDWSKAAEVAERLG